MSLDVRLTVWDVECYSSNITHNLGKMAAEADLYKPLWRPEELKIKYAAQLAPHLKKGLELLKSDPDRFSELNPANGWGNYTVLVEFVEAYLAACEKYPETIVRISR
jgi:hypothetical protein